MSKHDCVNNLIHSTKSLGSLCNVVKTLIVSGAQGTDQARDLLSCSGQLKIRL